MVVCRKSFAEFFALAKNKVKNIFRQGVYLTENTSQAASVEFVCYGRTNSARSRLQKNWRKAPQGIFDKLQGVLQKNVCNTPCGLIMHGYWSDDNPAKRWR